MLLLYCFEAPGICWMGSFKFSFTLLQFSWCNFRSTAAKKRHAKSAKIQAQIMEQRALAAAAALMESLRFLVETDTWNDSVEKMTKRLDMTCGTKVGIISDCTFHRA